MRVKRVAFARASISCRSFSLDQAEDCCAPRSSRTSSSTSHTRAKSCAYCSGEDKGGTQSVKHIGNRHEVDLGSTVQALVRKSCGQVRLATTTRTDEQEPPTGIQSEFSTYTKGILYLGNTVIERFEGTLTEGVQICSLTSLSEPLRCLQCFNASAQRASPEGGVAVGDIDSKSPCASTDRTDLTASRHMLFTLDRFHGVDGTRLSSSAKYRCDRLLFYLHSLR